MAHRPAAVRIGAPPQPADGLLSSTGGLITEIHGFCDERFRPLEDAFRANLDSGLDKGASLAVTLGGGFVVDLWGGTRDYELSKPWESDTVVRVFSTTKVMVVLMVLMLIDRGLLDLDEPIATYWPGFAKHGKGAITTRQVLVHQAGLPGFGRVVAFEDVGDPERSAAIVEDAALWYEPGTISCYHAQTFGAILGEVITRVSGTRFDEFFEREIARPLGADFHFGLPTEQATRVSTIWPATPNTAFRIRWLLLSKPRSSRAVGALPPTFRESWPRRAASAIQGPWLESERSSPWSERWMAGDT